MTFILSTLIDPTSEEFDLLRGEPVIRIGRRHDFLRVLSANAIPQLARPPVSGNESLAVLFLAERGRRRFERMQLQPCLRIVCVRSMATEAVVR